MDRALTQKPYKGWAMEGLTAKWYASLTRKSMDDFRALAIRVASGLPAHARVLEVAPGPGYFAIELAKLGAYSITGLDISRTFVDIARNNAAEAGLAVDFRQGDAAKMPFPNRSFDFLLCRAAFKNFSQPLRALQEMCRVLDSGGRAVIIDLRRDTSPAAVSRAVDEMHLGVINTILTKGAFRFMLLKRAYTKQQFQDFLKQTNFRSIDIRENFLGLELMLSR
ncbi:MAG: class I SAM-dependent methyltransferase [Bryobacterales bacterium]|nr:class I SAM-dependent methyltransferase [Bryobacterales bacterium]